MNCWCRQMSTHIPPPGFKFTVLVRIQNYFEVLFQCCQSNLTKLVLFIHKGKSGFSFKILKWWNIYVKKKIEANHFKDMLGMCWISMGEKMDEPGKSHLCIGHWSCTSRLKAMSSLNCPSGSTCLLPDTLG